jgi:hypothetical protein
VRSHGPAKAEIRVQVPAGGPIYPRVVKDISSRASNAALRVRVPPRGPFLRVAEKLRPPPSKRTDAGANPAAGTSLESESAEARTLSRKQMDRPDRLGRKTSALRHFVRRAARCGHPSGSPLTFVRGCAISALPRSVPPVAQKQSSRLIIGRPWCDSKQADHFGGLIPLGGSRGANASGGTLSLRGRTSTLRHCRVV